MIFVYGRFLFVANILTFIYTSEKFATDRYLTWRDYMKWAQLKEGKKIEDDWLKRMKSKDYVHESNLATYQKDLKCK